MIKIENTEVVGIEPAIRGMRNPLNSWDKSDSQYIYLNGFRAGYDIGENDLSLMKKLGNAGNDHGKFLRMITVYCDITAPLYWIAEHDTYKVGTTRNSCSFMHKGVSKKFEITDFSVSDDRIYYLLKDIDRPKVGMKYPYETDEYKEFVTENGRKYKVFRNGRIFAESFDNVQNYKSGRVRKFNERELTPYEDSRGYFEVHLGGRGGKTYLLHRIVASVWSPINNEELYTVDHIDGDKSNNSLENLQWVSLQDNIKKAHSDGTYEKNILHSSYIKWKRGFKSTTPTEKHQIIEDKKSGMSYGQLSEKYGLTTKQINSIIYSGSENEELFLNTFIWESTINQLNNLRDTYLQTGDKDVFQEIRRILPSGYNQRYTWCANYAVLKNIYHARKNHKLDEWHAFCDWIKTLPYSELITGEQNDD